MRTPHTFVIRHLSFVIAAALPLLALAQTPTTAPAPSALDSFPTPPGSRIIKTFDFEEKKDGNFENTPMFWSKVQGDGFPAFSSGKFDHTTFRSKDTSFKLEIDGGSAAFRYSPGKLPINPNADYYILAYVKTSALDFARIQLSAYFADDKDNLIAPATLHFDSQPYASPPPSASAPATNPKDDWHLLHLYIPGPGSSSPGSAAKSLVLQMGLLQPQQLIRTSNPSETPDLGEFALYQQELKKGAAWFDDITVIQLPRLSITVPASAPANIFAPNQPVELDLVVSDFAATPPPAQPTSAPAAANAKTTIGDQLAVSLKITDPDGLLAATEKFTLPASNPSSAPPWTYHFTHPAFSPGLYLASLEVADPLTGALIARRQIRFLCLAPAFAALEKPAADFGLVLPAYITNNLEFWPQLPHLLRHTRVGLLQLPVWRLDMSDEALLRRDPPFDSLLAAMQRLDVQAIAGFPELPTILAQKIAAAPRPAQDFRFKTDSKQDCPSSASILALAQSDPTIWRPYLSFLLARYANRIGYWEFGSQDNPYCGLPPLGPTAPVSEIPADRRYPQLYAKTSAELSTLIEGHHLLVPWNALYDFDPKIYPNANLDLRLPSSLKPAQFPAYIENFKQHGVASILAHIDPLDDKTPRHARLADFAQRIILARSANPAAILIDLPLAQSPILGSFTPRSEPDEILAVYRTLIQATGNSTDVRELFLAPDVKAFLFTRNNKDILVAWNQASTAPRIDLDLALGNTPRLIDLQGATRPLAPADNGLTHLTFTNTPIILDNIDSRPIQLRSSFALAANNFPSGAGAVRTEILLTNPYTDTMAGTLKLTPPEGWTIDPPIVLVSLAPGKTLHQPVTIRYPFNQFAGATAIAARLTLDNGPTYDLSAPAQIKSDVVELDGSTQFMPNGDLVIQQVITNISPNPINAQAYVLVPGYPREQRYILGLAPKQTVIKRFTLTAASYAGATTATKPSDIAAALAGKTAAIGLRENDGRTLITKALPLQ